MSGEDRVCAVLAGCGAATVLEVALRACLPPDEARVLLTRLAEEGRVDIYGHRDGYGCVLYQLRRPERAGRPSNWWDRVLGL